MPPSCVASSLCLSRHAFPESHVHQRSATRRVPATAVVPTFSDADRCPSLSSRARLASRPLPHPNDVPDVRKDARHKLRKQLAHESPLDVFRKAGCGVCPDEREPPGLNSRTIYLQIGGFWSGGTRIRTGTNPSKVMFLVLILVNFLVGSGRCCGLRS